MIESYDWSQHATSGDCRRATALMLHHLDNNEEGAWAILTEAQDETRLVPLILALLDQTLSIVPSLDSEAGRNMLRRGIARLAALENASNE